MNISNALVTISSFIAKGFRLWLYPRNLVSSLWEYLRKRVLYVNFNRFKSVGVLQGSVLGVMSFVC